MLQSSGAGSRYVASATESGAVWLLASRDWEDTVRPPRTAIATSPEPGWAASPLCLARVEKDCAAGATAGEVSFVLEWEMEGAVGGDWDEDGEEASYDDEKEDGEEKGEREEEPRDEEEATRTLEKRRNKEVRKRKEKRERERENQGKGK
jgi:hypothetical protein